MASVEKVCKNCGVTFEVPYKHRDKKYCSRSCYFEDARKNKIIGRKKDETVREERQCKVCGSSFIVRKKEKKEICSQECREVWGKRDDVKKRRLEKIRKTNLEKYGVEHVWSNPDIHKKCVENTDKDLSIEKQKNTVRHKHLKKLTKKLEENNLTLLDEYTVNKNSDGSSIHYKFNCGSCGNDFTSTLLGSGVIPVCRSCNPVTSNSKIELDFEKFLNECGVRYIKNDRKLIKPKELDFYLPDHNLAIELDGVYWHSERNGVDNEYHINKTRRCQEKGVKLIHIFSDEYNENRELVFSMVRNQLGINGNKIYGRKCVVKEINGKTKKEFLNKNHIQGDARSSTNLGMYHNNELVSVLTIGKRKITKGETKTEIVRYGTLMGYNVIGGFSKFISYIRKNDICQELMTYADIRWSGLDSDRVVYGKSGFDFIGETKPGYWYVKGGTDFREHRFKYRKSELVKKGFDPNKTEKQIMEENGYYRVWDCGNLKYNIIL